ncbi:MAG: hypothetical protein V1780_00970 [Chloroflexota bacterium]
MGVGLGAGAGVGVGAGVGAEVQAATVNNIINATRETMIRADGDVILIIDIPPLW